MPAHAPCRPFYASGSSPFASCIIQPRGGGGGATWQFFVEQEDARVCHGSISDDSSIRAHSACCGERGCCLAFAPDYASSGPSTSLTTRQRHGRGAIHPLTPTWSIFVPIDLHLRGLADSSASLRNHNGDILRRADGNLYIGSATRLVNDADHRAEPERTARQNLRNRVTSLPTLVRLPNFQQTTSFNRPSTAPDRSGFCRATWRTLRRRGPGGTARLVIADFGRNREEINSERRRRRPQLRLAQFRRHARERQLSSAVLYAAGPIFESGAAMLLSDGRFVYGARSRSVTADGILADYSGRVWSLALTIETSGEARASDRREHTTELGGSTVLGLISSFGVDADGEIYVVNHSVGRIVRITAPLTAPPTPTGLKIVKP